jgi:hypothetical protein
MKKSVPDTQASDATVRFGPAGSPVVLHLGFASRRPPPNHGTGLQVAGAGAARGNPGFVALARRPQRSSCFWPGVFA